jgi:hypothetical protein
MSLGESSVGVVTSASVIVSSGRWYYPYSCHSFTSLIPLGVVSFTDFERSKSDVSLTYLNWLVELLDNRMRSLISAPDRSECFGEDVLSKAPLLR